MRDLNSGTKLACLAEVICCLLLLLSLPARAFDSVKNMPVTVIPISGVAPTCSYHYLDTYYGAISPGGMQNGTSMELSFTGNFWSNSQQAVVSSPSGVSPMVPCSGTYQIIFSIELKAINNLATIQVTPTLSDDMTGATLYPPTGVAAAMPLYPQCNNSGYTATPYCSVGWVTGSVQAYMPINDAVYLTLITNSPVTVVGGQIEMMYLHP